MLDLESLAQVINNVNEAKEALAIAKEERDDIAEELIEIVLGEERDVTQELRDRLRHVEHDIDVAKESITASKKMLIAMIEEDDL